MTHDTPSAAKADRHGWQAVQDAMPRKHERYRVRRFGLEEFHATPCYGMHKPWWVPRNGFTLEESAPIDMEPSDLWQPLPAPPETET